MDSDDVRFERLIGQQVGEGSARIVHAHNLDTGLVVKMSKTPPHASNRTEWFIWNSVRDVPTLSQLLGTCVEISTSGRFLIMERLDDLTTDSQRLTRRYPGWLTDMKASAFGVTSNGAVKIRDYGMATLGTPLRATTIHDIPPDEKMDEWIKLLGDE